MENMETKFRTLLVELAEYLQTEDLQKLKFIYGLSDEEFAKVKVSFQFFQLLIEARHLSCDRIHLSFLAKRLGSIQKPELKTRVDTFITDHLPLSSNDVSSTPAVQECGQQLSGLEISGHVIPGRSRKRRRVVPEDKGTFEVRELYDEVMVCDSTSDSSDGDDSVLPDSKDRYYIEEAQKLASRSPDTDTKVGALLVSSSHPREILGVGWNRMPKGCEDRFPWASDGDPLEQKYPYVLHGGVAAMLDALKKFNVDKIEGSTLYITLHPDNKDAQIIRELGIKEVVYVENKYSTKVFAKASKKLLEGVKRRKLCEHTESS